MSNASFKERYDETPGTPEGVAAPKVVSRWAGLTVKFAALSLINGNTEQHFDVVFAERGQALERFMAALYAVVAVIAGLPSILLVAPYGVIAAFFAGSAAATLAVLSLAILLGIRQRHAAMHGNPIPSGVVRH